MEEKDEIEIQIEGVFLPEYVDIISPLLTKNDVFIITPDSGGWQKLNSAEKSYFYNGENVPVLITHDYNILNMSNSICYNVIYHFYCDRLTYALNFYDEYTWQNTEWVDQLIDSIESFYRENT